MVLDLQNNLQNGPQNMSQKMIIFPHLEGGGLPGGGTPRDVHLRAFRMQIHVAGCEFGSFSKPASNCYSWDRIEFKVFDRASDKIPHI